MFSPICFTNFFQFVKEKKLLIVQKRGGFLSLTVQKKSQQIFVEKIRRFGIRDWLYSPLNFYI